MTQSQIKKLQKALEVGDTETAKLILQKAKPSTIAKKPKVRKVKAKVALATEENTETGSILIIPGEARSPFELQKPAEFDKRIKTGIKKNIFKSNPNDCADAKQFDEIFWKGREPQARDRPEVKNTQVQVMCDRCNQLYTAESYDVHKKIEGEAAENICQKCLKKWH